MMHCSVGLCMSEEPIELGISALRRSMCMGMEVTVWTCPEVGFDFLLTPPFCILLRAACNCGRDIAWPPGNLLLLSESRLSSGWMATLCQGPVKLGAKLPAAFVQMLCCIKELLLV